jgi:CBS domain-containing protein
VALIAERMSRRLLTIEPSATLGDAAKRMVERNVGSIVVLEGERVVGILTERDIMRAFAADTELSAPLRQWMTHSPETCEPHESMEHAMTLMLHGGFRHLPIVEGDRLVGILSLRDVVGATSSDYAPRGV